jgi:hypothetical protein
VAPRLVARMPKAAAARDQTPIDQDSMAVARAQARTIERPGEHLRRADWRGVYSPWQRGHLARRTDPVPSWVCRAAAIFRLAPYSARLLRVATSHKFQDRDGMHTACNEPTLQSIARKEGRSPQNGGCVTVVGRAQLLLDGPGDEPPPGSRWRRRPPACHPLTLSLNQPARPDPTP